MGIKDDNIDVFPEDIRRVYAADLKVMPPDIIVTKKSSFIEKFIEASREYKDRSIDMDICTGGSIHKLLEALNHAHIDVVITTGSQSVMPAANDMASGLVGLQLRLKKADEQAYILSHWDDENDEILINFKTNVSESVDRGLKNYFGTLLPETSRLEIIASLNDLARPPLPHKELNDLVTIILNQIEIRKSGDDVRKLCVEKLHHFARSIYFKNTNDDKKYQILSSEYTAFKELDSLMYPAQIKRNDFENSPEFKTLKSDIQEVYSDNTLLFSQRLEAIKSLLVSFEEWITNLPEANILLNKFDLYLKKIDDLQSSITNPIHKQQLDEFKKKIVMDISDFKSKINDPKENIKLLTQLLNNNLLEDIKKVQIQLEKEPGIWRNLHPIIKGILGILAALTILPGAIIQLTFSHRYRGTFFTTPETESTKKFKELSLDVHPKDTDYSTTSTGDSQNPKL